MDWISGKATVEGGKRVLENIAGPTTPNFGIGSPKNEKEK